MPPDQKIFWVGGYPFVEGVNVPEFEQEKQAGAVNTAQAETPAPELQKPTSLIPGVDGPTMPT